jgi:phosphonate transport system substrate-binding protein
MAQTGWAKSLQRRRWYLVIGAVVFSFTLLNLVLAWGSAQAGRMDARFSAGQEEQAQNQEVIHLEFIYLGGDLISVTNTIDEFANLLSVETGLNVDASLQPCARLVIDHLGNGQADAAPLQAFSYLLGHEMYGMQARLVIGRFGGSTFRSQLNIQSASGFTGIMDLQGKRFVAPDPNSLTGYYAPYVLISDTTGMTPSEFFSEVNFVGSHAQVIREVYSGTADVGSTFDDARGSLLVELPDVNSVVKVLTYTQPVPNDPWVFRAGLDPTTSQTLVDGIMAVAGTPGGASALETIFGFPLSGLDPIEDSDYDIYRKFVSVFGLETETCNQIFVPVIKKDLGP